MRTLLIIISLLFLSCCGKPKTTQGNIISESKEIGSMEGIPLFSIEIDGNEYILLGGGGHSILGICPRVPPKLEKDKVRVVVEGKTYDVEPKHLEVVK